MFTTALNTLLDTEGNRTISEADLLTLYKHIVPNGSFLPRCVNLNDTWHSWFVPLQDNTAEYTSCLARDSNLRQAAAVTLALKPIGTAGSGTWWRGGDVLAGGGRWERPPFETLVALVGTVLEVRQDVEGYSGRRQLTNKDRRMFTDYICKKVQELQRDMAYDEQQALLLQSVPGDNAPDDVLARWMLLQGRPLF